MSHRIFTRGGAPAISLACSLGLLTVPAMADEGAVDYRTHVMEAIGGHMQAAVDIMKGSVDHKDHLSLHVNSIARLSKIAPTLFVEGSEGGDALPEIWEDADTFRTHLSAFEEAAAGLDTSVSSGQGVGQAFQELGQACKGCHDDYRAE